MKSFMMGLWIVIAVLAAGVAGAHPGEMATTIAPRFENATMRGEIIDPQCYFTHGSRGAAHASCAAMCAKGGQGLAFIDDASGTIYPLIAKAHGLNPNDGMIQHLGKTVQVKGVIYHRTANTVLLVQSVTAAPVKTK